MMRPNDHYDIFVSFADEDKSFAIALCEALQAQGLKVWCSAKDVPTGADIHAAVSHALPHCRYFLPIISEHYGRFWHAKEFHSAAHNRPNELIIPIAYQTDYEAINSREMFSLISSIRIIETQEKPICLVAKEVEEKVTETQKATSKRYKPFEITAFFRNKVVQMCLAAMLVWLTYVAIDKYNLQQNKAEKNAQFEKKLASIKPLTIQEIFKEESIFPTTAIDFSQKDRFSFKIIKIRPEKDNECTNKKCACDGLITVHFELLNKGSEAVHIIALKIEAKRSEELIFQNKTAELMIPKERDDCDSPFGIWLVEIPQDKENIHYLYELSGQSVRCEAGKRIDIPVVLYQVKQNVNKGKPSLPKDIEFTFTFITDEKSNAKSKRCFFEKGELICED